jgi:ATP-dependent Clp protease ATP-binding subunit ClpC
VFERFTERARQVVVLAQDEARALKHNYIGTEHLLLGLLREEEGVAARVLESLDVTLDQVRAQVARIVGQSNELSTGQIPFTPRAKRVLELALKESRSLGHDYIDTGHVLLGLVHEGGGVAVRILADLGADAERIRTETIDRLPAREARARLVRKPKPPAGVVIRRRMGRRTVSEARARASQRQLTELKGSVRFAWIVALVIAALSFPLGLLIGWLIWG